MQKYQLVSKNQIFLQTTQYFLLVNTLRDTYNIKLDACAKNICKVVICPSL
jgi:hypothetical protein